MEPEEEFLRAHRKISVRLGCPTLERFPRSRPREANSYARDFPKKKSSQSGASRTVKGRGSKNVASTVFQGGVL